MFPNYYQILGVSKQATKIEIKKAYRKLALEFHPDVNNSADAHEKFISINEAYLILFDNEARIKYDIEYTYHIKNNSHFRTEPGAKEEEIRNQSPQSEIFEDSDLNDWSSKAREQGAEYARMVFQDFSDLVLGFVKETGFQLGNSLLVFLGLILTISGCGNIIIGLSTKGEMGNPILGIIILPVGFLIWSAAFKNWDNHKK